MVISIHCENCSRQYRVPDDQHGLRLKCTNCGTLIKIPVQKPNENGSEEERTKKKTSKLAARLKIGVSVLIVLGTIGVIRLILAPRGHDSSSSDSAKKNETDQPPFDRAKFDLAENEEDERLSKERLSEEGTKFLRGMRFPAATGEIHNPVVYSRLHEFASEYPHLKVSQEADKPIWNKVRVNTTKAGFCVVRFRSPLNVPADFFCTFADPRVVPKWAIVPMKGRFRSGIDAHYDWQEFLQFEDYILPAENRVTSQRILGGHVKPNTDYLIWFLFNTTESFDLNIALTLLPESDAKNAKIRNLREMTQHMGLKVLSPEFERNEQGTVDALRYSSSLFMKSENLASDKLFKEFETVLRSVSEGLPRFKVSAGRETPDWQSYVFHSSGLVDAFRISSPLNERSYLSLAVLAPDSFRKWGLLPLTGEGKKPPDFALVADVQIKGLETPADNVGLFQHFSDFPIDPGQDYLLWFASWEEQPAPSHVAMKLTAQPLTQNRPTFQDISTHMGLSIERPPLDEQRIAVQRGAHRMMASKRPVDRIQRLVDSGAEAIPSGRLTKDSASPAFNELQANRDNHFFAAMRFRSPFDKPADLDIFITTSGASLQTNISRIEGQPKVYSFEEKNVQLENHVLPTLNQSAIRAVRRGPILPNRDYFVWFAPYEEKEADIRVVLRVSPLGQNPPPKSFRGLGSWLGLKFPISPGPEGSEILGEHDDLVDSVKFSPDGKSLYSVGWEHQVKIWDVATRKLSNTSDLRPLNVSMLVKANGLPDQYTLASHAGNMKILNLSQDKTVRSWPIPKVPFESGSLSHDGSMVAASFTNPRTKLTMLILWDANTGRKIAERQLPAGLVKQVRFSADGGTLFTVGSVIKPSSSHNEPIGRLIFWNTSDLTPEHQISQDIGRMQTVCTDPGGKWIATGDWFGRLNVFEMNSRKLTASLLQDCEVTSVVMTPDERFVVVGCGDGRIRIWDWRSNRIWIELRGHHEKIFGLDVSPNSRWLASGSRDGTVRLWDLEKLGQSPVAESHASEITNSLGMTLIPIPSGQFRMGTEEGELGLASERPAHQVRITHGYYLSQHEVTVGQFRQFVEATNYRTSAETDGTGGRWRGPNEGYRNDPKWTWQNPGYKITDRHPVTQVSWTDAVAFCDWLSEKEQAKYRLPTEAEWEIACRAGSDAAASGKSEWTLVKAANLADLSYVGIYKATRNALALDDGHVYPAPVGEYLPNAFNLHDMLGNVSEWCSDRYDPQAYTGTIRIDPTGPGQGDTRVVRGGSCVNVPERVRPSVRDEKKPDHRVGSLGFRVLREIP